VNAICKSALVGAALACLVGFAPDIARASAIDDETGAQAPETQQTKQELQHETPAKGSAEEKLHEEAAGAAPADARHEHVHVGAANLTTKGKDASEIRKDLAVWSWIVFLIVLFVLWRTAWKPILAGLKKREDQIAENIAAAQRQHDEARRLLEQYERKLAGAASQVREIMDEARRDAQHTQQEIIARARAEAQTEKNRTLVEIDTARQQALKDIAEKSTDMAIDLAGRIIRAKLSPADHKELIQEAVGRLTQAPSEN
jgi:F-type H+-transporting ATPase subunit b